MDFTDLFSSGYQGQDAGRKGRRAEKDAGDAGTDAGDKGKYSGHSWMSNFLKPYLYPIFPYLDPISHTLSVS